MDRLGEHLIFLISQPRAGSTLLQRILGCHPHIHTLSEPWLMLHPFYALRPNGYEAEYNGWLAQNALRTFLQALPDGEEAYFEGVRRMYAYLYEQALANSGRTYFLDKTPRYYFIIPELYHAFPEAHYIILLRNPLAVFCSVVRTWVEENWLGLYHFRHDLIRAPALLVEGLQRLGDQGVVVRYESLVNSPEDEMRRICSRLGLEFVVEMVTYGKRDLPQWRFGDQREVYAHASPIAEYAEKWIQALEEPQMWRFANDYLRMLGPEIVNRMGYAYEELLHMLEMRRPQRIRLWTTLPLNRVLDKPHETHKKWRTCTIRLKRSLRQRGILGTVLVAIRRAIHALPNPE